MFVSRRVGWTGLGCPVLKSREGKLRIAIPWFSAELPPRLDISKSRNLSSSISSSQLFCYPCSEEAVPYTKK